MVKVKPWRTDALRVDSSWCSSPLSQVRGPDQRLWNEQRGKTMRENRSLPGSCLHRSRLSPGSLSAGTASALVALAIFLLLLSAPFLYGDVSAGAGAPTAQDGSEQEGKKKKRKKGTKSKLSPDALLVKKHLKDYLHPSSIKFMKGGRVKLLFAFREKSEYHEKIFLPPIGSGVTAPFRWSLETEERTVGSARGLRISNRGFTLLDCWFLDDVYS